MPLFFYKFSKNVITSGGVSETSTTKIRGILMHIIIRANSDDTTFDFQLYDDDSVVIFERNDVDGGINEQVMIPVEGEYTLSITQASANETFRIYFMIREL